MDFEVVFFQFIYAMVPFFLEIAVAEGLFMIGLKRRPMFWARLLAGVAVCAATLFLASVALAYFTHFLIGALIYIVVFAVTLGVLKVCFDESFATILFCGVAAYAMQNMCYRTMCIAEICGLVWRLSAFMPYRLAYDLITWLLYALIGVAVWFLVARRIKKYSLARIHGKNIMYISIITLTVTVLLCSWTNVYYWQHFWLLLINCVFSVLSCVFILCLQSGMLENVGLKYDLEIVEKLWHDDKRRYEISRENIDIINVKCHDLKHRLKEIRLRDDGITREEIEEIENAVGIYDSNTSTGCEPLDVILTEKSLYCHKNGIKLTCMADGKSLSFMRAGDLYSLFGNMLSNAIEATKKVKDRNRRVIAFTVRHMGEMLIVCIENYYEGGIVFRDGLPVTSKRDTVNHGYGMKSMKMLVDKYGGEMTVSADGETYRLKIMLPLPKTKDLKSAG